MSIRYRKWTKFALRSALYRRGAANLIITRRCDLACSYCRATQVRTPELSVNEWHGIVQQLRRGYSVFTLSGGEPLLYKALPELVERIAPLGIIGLCTNLKRISEADLQNLQQLDYLNFSIDHIDKREISKKNAFGKLELLREYAKYNQYQLQGTTVIGWRNYQEVPAIIERMSQLKIPTNLQLIQHPANEDAFNTPERLQELLRLQDELLTMQRQGYLIDESRSYLSGMSGFVTEQHQVNCLAGESYLAVNCDGRLMPCQDSSPVGRPMTQIENGKQEIIELANKRPHGCRCWWNCYHRDSEWSKSPLKFLANRAWTALTRPTPPTR